MGGFDAAARWVSIDRTLLSEPCGTDPLICAVAGHGADGEVHRVLASAVVMSVGIRSLELDLETDRERAERHERERQEERERAKRKREEDHERREREREDK
jgi:hypothetical protein